MSKIFFKELGLLTTQVKSASRILYSQIIKMFFCPKYIFHLSYNNFATVLNTIGMSYFILLLS